MPGQEEVLNNKENSVRFIANKSNKSNLGSTDNSKRWWKDINSKQERKIIIESTAFKLKLNWLE